MAKTSLQVKLTKTVVDEAEPLVVDGVPRQRLYLDSELKGFGLCVGAKTKTFFTQRDLNGKTVRVTIGRYGVFTVAKAREEARELLIRMSKGVNPNREKEQQRTASMTFDEALKMHLGSNKRRAARTVSEYRYLADQYLADWLARPLLEITRKNCRDRHQVIGAKNGPYAANSAFRVFRAAYNTALKVNEHLGVNPTIAVDWFTEHRRKAAILSNDLADWYKEVVTLANPIRRDYLLFVMFTGLRRENAASVRWSDVDWENKALIVPSPKSGRPFQLPLSDALIELLKARQTCDLTKTVFPNSVWVFPAESKKGHIAEPREELGVSFTIHGLRNTFITVAESLDVSPYAIKMLVNHSTPDKQDVTAGYITPELQRLRLPMQQITNRLRALCQGKTGAEQ
ncbi:MAG: integrase arm-type DNA-binding domain-containing protein [Rhodoferax sp.]|nr:integrase arm-type DNA-binding domain-containing protein [Rhodoferax sp.]